MRFLLKNDFYYNVVKLILGTGAAQVLPLMLMPILTRVYSPEDFGVFAVYMALAGMLGVICTGRYELAIVMPDNSKTASDIFWLCLFISGGLSVICGLVILFSNNFLVAYLDLPEGTAILYLLPVGIFSAGLLQSLSYFSLAKKMIGNLSVSKAMMGTGTALTQVSISGIPNVSAGGLTIGYLVGKLFSALFLWCNSRRLVGARSSFQDIRLAASRYKRYPIISAPAALLDTAAVQLPLFFINKGFLTSIAGQFSLAARIMNVPLALIGPAVSQVLLQKIASSDLRNSEEIRKFVASLALKLGLLFSPICVFSFFYGEEMFLFIFGENWRVAGSFAFPLSLVMFFRFVVSPLSSVLSFEKNLKYGVFWQVSYFLVTFSILNYASQFSVDKLLAIFVLSEFFLYSAYLTLILKGTSSYRDASEY